MFYNSQLEFKSNWEEKMFWIYLFIICGEKTKLKVNEDWYCCIRKTELNEVKRISKTKLILIWPIFDESVILQFIYKTKNIKSRWYYTNQRI